MKLIKPTVEIIEQEPGIEGIYKQIEKAGRTSYKSENHITKDSAKKFTDMLEKAGHGAALEHGTVYLNVPKGKWNEIVDDQNFNFYDCPYIIWGERTNRSVLLTTNYRVIVEHHMEDLLKYVCEWTPYHERRITVKFICDRGVSHEFVRHRVFSFMQESTRYCNYSKDKFGNEITICIPSWLNLPEMSVKYHDGVYIDTPGFSIVDFEEESSFLWATAFAENQYFKLLEQGWKPQQARAVLPNALKTELIMTGTIKQWKGFFALRSPKCGAIGPHPDAAYLADMLYDKFVEKEYF
jgi:thymidylate synthase (FAD)